MAFRGLSITKGFKKQWFCASSAAVGRATLLDRIMRPSPGQLPSSIIESSVGGKHDLIITACLALISSQIMVEKTYVGTTYFV